MTRKIQSFLAACTVFGALTTWLKADLLDSTNSLRVSFPDARLTVNGLAWFNEDRPTLRRLPLRLKDTFRAPVWSLAQDTSGGRIRFKTDSTRIGLRAKNPDTSGMHHMTTIGQSGFDIYINNEYMGSAWPDNSGDIVKEWTVGTNRALRDVTLYLPLYKGVAIQEVILESDAKIEPPPPFARSKPVVYYGSSITQGGCASNPGLSCQAQLSRWLNLDFINLGFSGNGLGEPAIADAVSEIDASCFVLDYWGNPSAEVYRDTLPTFVQTLRKRYPKTPILITGAYFFPSETLTAKNEGPLAEKRKTAKDFVTNQRRAGDKFIAYVDGLEMLSREQAFGLVDGVHCNSLGFYFCAKGLEPHLRKAIKLRP